ncbi:MAG: flagellar basal body-associated FliL family protein [Nitrospinae bacterium]|nr:flagellar basal body-associated FliL family protein [Nitrospinota bacterium]
MAKKRRTELDIDKDLAPEPAPPPPPPVEAPPPPPPPEESAEAPRPVRKINKVKLMILVGLGTLGLLLTGLLIWGGVSLYASNQAKKAAEEAAKAEAAKAAKEPPAPKPNLYALQPFFINLAPGKGNGKATFARIEFSLETGSPAVEKDIERNVTLVRENIFFLLRNMSEDDLKGEEKLRQLSVDVAISINRSIQSGGITRALITELVLN